MKFILSLIFCLAAVSTFGQKTIDENGRPAGSKPVNVVSSIENEIYLRKNIVQSSATSITLEYSLPFGSSTGKLVLFHPRKDEEIKTIVLNGNNGSVVLSAKEIGFETFNAGLYLSDGTFVKSQSIF
jgi:hypothetical protein